MRTHIFLLAAATVALGGCGSDETRPPPIVGPAPTPSPTSTPTPSPTPSPSPITAELDFDFSQGEDGFTPVFSEYPEDADLDIYEFDAGIETVPGLGVQGFRMFSVNRSDDVFMFLWKPIDGLIPLQEYRVEATVRFAANVPPGCVGAGGSPGGVVIQAGASPVEPMLEVSTDPGNAGLLVPNFEHGTQNADDGSPFSIGIIEQVIPGGTCGGFGPFQEKELSTDPDNAPIVTTDEEGRLWAFMGTDSNWEGETEIYWLSGTFLFVPE
ncbi:hypothetical protein [Erythrobacter sp.]|jgi:hypothetical protein|uniref:hypothetical protein n=1 Tax=Erythrobacter sp. TaxID=1042 RepID=UPI002EAC50E2|nr:hypothetical protein [Erythrobacter sp.]